jgi:hypothetical protein
VELLEGESDVVEEPGELVVGEGVGGVGEVDGGLH